MSRQLDTHRLYLLSRAVVVIVSIASLAYAAYVLSQLDAVSSNYAFEMPRCMEMFRDYNPEENCSMWTRYLDDANSAVRYGFLIGFGLPIVFFGGKLLLNYVAPVKKGKK